MTVAPQACPQKKKKKSVPKILKTYRRSCSCRLKEKKECIVVGTAKGEGRKEVGKEVEKLHRDGGIGLFIHFDSKN